MSAPFIQNGQLNTILIVGIIAVVLVFAWQFFTRANPASFSTTLSKLPVEFQTAINLLFAPGAPLLVNYNGTPLSLQVWQVYGTNDYQAVSFSSSDYSVNIYMTYYEFCNWTYSSTDAAHASTLSIPARTLSNDVITDDASGGYSLTGIYPNYIINSLTGAVTPGLINSAGATISLNNLPALPLS